MNEPQRQQPPDESPPPGMPEPARALPKAPRPMKVSAFVTLLVAVFGVVLPAFTLGFELTLRWCTSELFDPVPTVVHMLLVAGVPAANLLALVATSKRTPRLLRNTVIINGMALGVSLVYALLFLPFTPVALIGVLFLGAGLMPLSPLLSFCLALVMRSRLKRVLPSGAPMAASWIGMGVALMAFLIVEAPVSGTRMALHVAVNGSPESQRTALQWLRRLGSEETLLTACYFAPRRATLVDFLLSWDDSVSVEEARTVYYRVTGKTFNSVPKPERVHLEGGFRSNDDDQGGREVGGRVPGLSLASSELKGSVDGDAALAYLEWTMSFETTAEGQSEARTELILPPGAVVSRVTLYIDGQEREAAFASTAKAREAYEAVVRTRRDPLLVTYKGKDRVQVQCFPVVKGPPMKIKLGITAPLLPKDDGRNATLLLPSLAERNFHIADDFRHAVRVESLRRLSTQAGGSVEQRKDGVSEWLGALGDEALHPPQAMLTVQRKGAPDTAWTEDLLEPTGYVVRQRLLRTRVEMPERVILVLDGSVGMKDALPEIASALGSFPQETELAVLASLDGVEELLPPGKVDAAVLQSLAERVRELPTAGGQDANAVLARAWSMVAPQGRTAVVWIHGPHPMSLELEPRSTPGDEGTSVWWRAPPLPAVLLDVMVGRGPNQMAVGLADRTPLQAVPRTAPLEQDLKTLFTRWGSEAPEFYRERLPLAELKLPPEGWKTSSHLARLWAAGEIARLAESEQEPTRARALELATHHQLVSAVSGAVVLERQSQYDAAGLKPVDPGSVPSVPEPETWMLLGVACLLLIAFRLRRAA
ncbi:VIT domain-containing protein [Archangium lansingense]|uniref:VIT domain-containing protein n=1 Tax=Archangium lansingense TaxID=2995310 RepID=UPI003B7E86DE